MTGPQSSAVRDAYQDWRTRRNDGDTKNRLSGFIQTPHHPGWGVGNVALAITRHTRTWTAQERSRFLALCRDVSPEVATILERWSLVETADV